MNAIFHTIMEARFGKLQDTLKQQIMWLQVLLQGDLPDPRIEPMSLESPALAGGFFTTAPPEEPL